MLRNLFAPLLAASALALTVSPAHAGKEDRARSAIAAAEAKLETAETMGAGSELPRELADTRAALAMAQEHFRADRNAPAISTAIRAQALADAMIGEMENRKKTAAADAQQMRNEDVAVAQQQAAMAQGQAADANARAAAAERSAANSAADAQAARLAAQQPREVETTVTTQQPGARVTTSAPRKTTVRRTTTTRRTVVAPPTTTTTTVRQAVN